MERMGNYYLVMFTAYAANDNVLQINYVTNV